MRSFLLGAALLLPFLLGFMGTFLPDEQGPVPLTDPRISTITGIYNGDILVYAGYVGCQTACPTALSAYHRYRETNVQVPPLVFINLFTQIPNKEAQAYVNAFDSTKAHSIPYNTTFDDPLFHHLRIRFERTPFDKTNPITHTNTLFKLTITNGLITHFETVNPRFPENN